MPLGSFSGGFSSTDGYVPVNEAQIRRLERRSTCQADQFLEALTVFIPITRPALRQAQQAFRLRSRASMTVAFRSFCPQTVASPHQFHFPSPVKMPVSNLDCVIRLHQPIFMSSRKHFNYCLILQWFTGVPVDNFLTLLWIKLWKTPQTHQRLKLRKCYMFLTN